MGFKDKKKDRQKAPPAKKTTKPEAKKPANTIQSNRMVKEKAPVEKKPEVKAPVVKEKAASVVETPAVRQKTDYYGIGVTGVHSEITKFKGTCKLKNMKVGEEVIKMLRAWNIANPVS